VNEELEATPPLLSSVEAAVEVLEQADLRGLVEDPSALAEALIARQYALDFLKSHRLSSDVEGSELRGRLAAVSRRDAEVMQLLQQAKAQVGELLGKVVSGRALARGYGGLSGSEAPATMGAKRVG
jgi:hypothetical protein